MGLKGLTGAASVTLLLTLLLAPLGDALTLEDPLVYPREIERGERVLITVLVRDENGTGPQSVRVWVGGKWWEMEPEGDDLNYTRGVLYRAEVPLEKSVRKVVFLGVDSAGEQYTVEYNVTLVVREGSELPRYICYAAAALFLLLVVATVISRFRAPKGGAPAPRLPEMGEALCSSCGRAVPADASICPYCGERFVEEEHICPRCGGSVSPSDTVCPKCGAKLEPVYPVTDADLLKLSSPEDAGEKMVCPNCGAVLLEGMETCPGCGKVVEISAEKEKG